MKIDLILPKQGESVSQLSAQQKNFIENCGSTDKKVDDIDWLNLIQEGVERSVPEPVSFVWDISGYAVTSADTRVILSVSENEDMSDATETVCPKNTCDVYHLFIGRHYFWQVKVVRCGTVLTSSEIRRFNVADETPRLIRVGGLTNVRDIGGYACIDGRVRQGLVYRGSEMEFHHDLTDEGRDALVDRLGIKTDLDLRIEAVDKIDSSAMGKNVDLQLIPAKAYDEFLLEKDVCRDIFKLFCDEERYPFYVHCWGGADRTGTVILLLSAILGVDEADLFCDYELTSLSIWGERSIRSKHFTALMSGLDAYGSEKDSLNKKCENYLLSCGITSDEIQKIRKILIEKA